MIDEKQVIDLLMRDQLIDRVLDDCPPVKTLHTHKLPDLGNFLLCTQPERIPYGWRGFPEIGVDFLKDDPIDVFLVVMKTVVTQFKINILANRQADSHANCQ